MACPVVVKFVVKSAAVSPKLVSAPIEISRAAVDGENVTFAVPELTRSVAPAKSTSPPVSVTAAFVVVMLPVFCKTTSPSGAPVAGVSPSESAVIATVPAPLVMA